MRVCDLDEIKVCIDRQYKNCHGYSGSKKAIYREAILAVKSILHSAKPIDGVTVQEWISVKDRLPDACGFPCLLCGKNSFGQIRVFEGFTGYMERGKFEWHSNHKDIDIDVWTITHWMPLPEPPKGE